MCRLGLIYTSIATPVLTIGCLNVMYVNEFIDVDLKQIFSSHYVIKSTDCFQFISPEAEMNTFKGTALHGDI